MTDNLVQGSFVDYKKYGDTGEDTTAATQPIGYLGGTEPARPDVVNRGPENLRGRSETLRALENDLLYYRDRSQYLMSLAAGGALTWGGTVALGGTGIANATTALTLTPMAGPSANVLGFLHAGIPAVNQILYDVAVGTYAADGINALFVEHRSVTGTVTPLCTISAGPVKRILVVYDAAVPAHDAPTIAPIVAAAVAADAYLTGKLAVTANGLAGTALTPLTETGFETRIYGAYTRRTADAEAHVIPAGALSTLTTTRPLAEGDFIGIRYDYVVEPAVSITDPKGGVPGGRAESNLSRGNSDVTANLFVGQDNTKFLPGCVPVCRVVNNQLVWCDLTRLGVGVNGVPGSVVSAATAIAYAGGPAWADGTTNPATTVEAQLDKVITDLASTTAAEGAYRIGMPAVAAWADGDTNPATTLGARVTGIVADLTGAGGSSKIYGNALTTTKGLITTVAAGPVGVQLSDVMARLETEKLARLKQRALNLRAAIYTATVGHYARDFVAAPLTLGHPMVHLMSAETTLSTEDVLFATLSGAQTAFWTAQAYGTPNNYLMHGCYGFGAFRVFVGQKDNASGASLQVTGGYAAPAAFTPTGLTAAGGIAYDVVHTGTRWVVCGTDGTAAKVITTTVANATSGWGLAATAPVTATPLVALAYDPVGNVLVAISHTTAIWYSTDHGVNWTAATGGTANMRAVSWDAVNSTFVIVGKAGVILTSATGVVFATSALTAQLTTVDWYGVAADAAGTLVLHGLDSYAGYAGVIGASQDGCTTLAVNVVANLPNTLETAAQLGYHTVRYTGGRFYVAPGGVGTFLISDTLDGDQIFS